MEIRQAKLNDASHLGKLSNQLGYPTSTRQSVKRLKFLLASKENVIFVSYIPDGKITGWIHAFLAHRLESDPFAEISGFVVDGAYRGSGAGKKLLSAVEKWVCNHNIFKLRIRSHIARKESHVVFDHLGFIKTKDQFVFDKKIKQL